MKVYCTICCEPWGASKYTIESTYVCPHCQKKIDHNEPIRLGRREEKIEKHTWGFKQSLVCTIGATR